MELPEGWQDQSAYFFKGPQIDDFDHDLLLNVDRFLQYDNVDDFAREKISPIVQSMPSIDVLKDKNVTGGGGNEVYEFVFKMVLADDLIQIHKYIFVIKDEMGFTFTIRYLKKTYKMLSNQTKEIVESVLPGTYKL